MGCGSEETFFVQWSSVVEQLTHKHAVSMFFFFAVVAVVGKENFILLL